MSHMRILMLSQPPQQLSMTEFRHYRLNPVQFSADKTGCLLEIAATMENTVQEAKTLPPRVAYVKVGDKDVYLVGTAHISRESVEDVRTTIEQVHPDAICVELCQARHQAMTQADNWRKMDIFKIIRQKKAVFLLAQLIMSSFYRRLGEKLGVQPGAADARRRPHGRADRGHAGPGRSRH